MAVMSFFNVGLDQLGAWTTGTYKWVLVTAGTINADLDNVTALVAAAPEITVTGYTRVTVATPARVVDDTADTITYTAGNPSFGTLDPGEDVAAVVLIKDNGSDATSIPIGWWALSPVVATDIADPFTFSLIDGTVAYVDAV